MLPIRRMSTSSDRLSEDTTHRSTVLEAFPRSFYSLAFHLRPSQKYGQLVWGWNALTARTIKHSLAEECFYPVRESLILPPLCGLCRTKVYCDIIISMMVHLKDREMCTNWPTISSSVFLDFEFWMSLN